MAGKKLPLINLLLALLVLLCGTQGRAATTASDAPLVVILISDLEEAYTAPVAVFSEQIGMPTAHFNLMGDIDRAPALMAEILAKKPALIFALGAKAAYVAKVWTKDHPDIPVIFAMVVNWERYNLLAGQNNIAGIASDVDPGTQLANILLVSSKIKRIGVVYNSEYSETIMDKTRKAAQVLGIDLLEEPIARPQEFQRAFKRMIDRIDGFIMLADPVLFTLENVAWLEKRCIRERLVCAGPSENIARLGILLSVNPDNANIGAQAASVAKSILSKKTEPGRIGVMPPLGTRLFLNLKTASQIGLAIDQTVVDLASDVIN